MNSETTIRADDAIAVEPTPRRRLRLTLMFAVPALLIAVALYFWLTSGRSVSTDNAMVDAPVASIAPEVTGRIAEVDVRENDLVPKGAVLFRIDPAPFRIALLQAEAARDAAQVGYAQLQSTATSRAADIGSKSADLGAARAAVELAQENFKRQQNLLARGFTTRANYDSARAALNSARQQEAAAVADQRAAEATAQSARAALGNGAAGLPPALEAAMAQVEKARLDLARTVVRAPIAGRVTQADRLQLGNLAPQSVPVVSIVDVQSYWIEANFKETQLAKIRPGQNAEVEIDAIPGRRFPARVASIGAGTGSQFSILPAQNATGNWVKVTQRVPVRLALLVNPDRPLVAGWSARVRVDIR